MSKRTSNVDRGLLDLLVDHELSKYPEYVAARTRLRMCLPHASRPVGTEQYEKDKIVIRTAYKVFNTAVGRLVKNARARVLRKMRKSQEKHNAAQE